MRPAQYFPESARYTGSGPHPITVLEEKGQGSLNKEVSFNGNDNARDWTEQDARRIQLVACAARKHEHALATTCHYDKGELTLFTATFTVKVYEARGAHELGSVTLDPQNPQCPKMAEIYRDSRVYATPTPDQYRAALSRFVSGVPVAH